MGIICFQVYITIKRIRIIMNDKSLQQHIIIFYVNVCSCLGIHSVFFHILFN